MCWALLRLLPLLPILLLLLSSSTMSSFTSILQSQISTAVKKVLADMDQSEQSAEFVTALFAELFPGTEVPETKAPDSDTESTESKKGRKKGPMSDEAKAAMVAKRKATMEAKANEPKPAEGEAKPEPKAKLTKEEASKARSEAAKARYAALSEEEKAANKARLAAGKAAKKAAAEVTA